MTRARVPKSERRQHVRVDAGDGITVVVQQPEGARPLSPEVQEAIASLARAAARRMERGGLVP